MKNKFCYVIKNKIDGDIDSYFIQKEEEYPSIKTILEYEKELFIETGNEHVVINAFRVQ